MKTYQLAGYISILGFIATTLMNSFMIFLTISHIKHIFGTYKKMIVLFSMLGIFFSAWDVIMKPCIHNFNGGFMYFSLNTFLPNWLLVFCIACYSGFYSLLLAFVAVQFLYRYFTLTGSLWIRTFQGWEAVIWVSFCLIPCSLFVIFDTFLMPPDAFSDNYMRREIFEIYQREIEDIPRFIMIPWRDDQASWKDITFIISISMVMELELMVIGYCAFRMTRELRNQVKVLSAKNRKLEAQFFKALLAQSAFPTLLLALPTGPILLLPLFNTQVSLQSSLLYSLFSLYPSLDSVAMMLIITEYRLCAERWWNGLRKKPNVIVVQSISASYWTTMV